MSIDQSTEYRPINIKELVVESPRPKQESPFDFRRNVSAENWTKIRNGLDTTKDYSKISELRNDDFLFIRSASIVAPNEVQLRMDDEFWSSMMYSREKSIERIQVNPVLTKLEIATSMKLAFPDKAKNENLLYDEELEEIQGIFNIMQTGGNIHDVFDIAANMRLYDPIKFQNFEIKDHTWQDTKQRILLLWQSKEFKLLTGLLTNIKIVSPQKFSNLGLDGEVLNDVLSKEKEEQNSSQLIATYTLGLSRIAILTAEDIKVTDKGIEFVYPVADKQLIPETPLPNQRKF